MTKDQLEHIIELRDRLEQCKRELDYANIILTDSKGYPNDVVDFDLSTLSVESSHKAMSDLVEFFETQKLVAEKDFEDALESFACNASVPFPELETES